MNITDVIEALSDLRKSGLVPDVVLDDIDAWLASPCRALNNETPHDLIESGRGDEVLRLVRQIHDGIYD